MCTITAILVALFGMFLYGFENMNPAVFFFYAFFVLIGIVGDMSSDDNEKNNKTKGDNK